MPILRRVETVMTGTPGAPYYNGLHFLKIDGSPVQPLINLVAAFWNDFSFIQDSALTRQTQGEVPNVDDATGNIVDFEQGASAAGAGTSTAAESPSATQLVLRFRTNTVVNGRRLQGKVFVPGIATAAPGNRPDQETVSAVTAIGAQLITDSEAADAPLMIYSRTYNTSAVVTSASCWSEWGVMRSRRD